VVEITLGRIRLAQMVSSCSLSSLMTLLLLFSLRVVVVVICSEVKWLSQWLFMVLGQDVPEMTLLTAAISTSEVSQLCAAVKLACALSPRSADFLCDRGLALF